MAREISGLDCGYCVGYIEDAPQPVLIQGEVVDFVGVQWRNIMERACLGVFPGNGCAFRIEPSRKVMDRRSLEMTVLHVVGARSKELHPRLRRVRNRPRGVARSGRQSR